jgi:hypothetical protein
MNDRELLKQAVIKKMAAGMEDIWNTLSFQQAMQNWQGIKPNMPASQLTAAKQATKTGLGKGLTGWGALGLGGYGLKNLLYPQQDESRRRAIIL